MKKMISGLLMALVCSVALAETDQKVYRTFVKNDHRVFYCEHDVVTVVVDPTDGGLFEPHITIINESGREFVFEPKKIKVHAFAIPGNTMKSTRYRVERFLEKGDTLGFERDELCIYTPEKYSRKKTNAFWWNSVISEAVAAGIESIGNQDARTQYWLDSRREKRIDEAEAERKQEMKRISEGYWRANTIFDSSEHEGFIAIKPVKTKYLILDIPSMVRTSIS